MPSNSPRHPPFKFMPPYHSYLSSNLISSWNREATDITNNRPRRSVLCLITNSSPVEVIWSRMTWRWIRDWIGKNGLPCLQLSNYWQYLISSYKISYSYLEWPVSYRCQKLNENFSRRPCCSFTFCIKLAPWKLHAFRTCYTSFQDPILTGASTASTSDVRAFIALLLIVGNWFWCPLMDNVRNKYRKKRSAGSKVKKDTHTEYGNLITN